LFYNVHIKIIYIYTYSVGSDRR